MVKVEKVDELTLALEDRPGILADLCANLAEQGVNIRAIMTGHPGAVGSVRMVVDAPERARDVLDQARVSWVAAPCLAVEMPNFPGSMAAIARSLAMAGVNVDRVYGSTRPEARAALAVFGVSDLDAALDALRQQLG